MAGRLLVDVCIDVVGEFLITNVVKASILLTDAGIRFILPLLGEYIDSGFRTPRSRMIYSMRSNGRYQLVVLACGIAGLVYVFYQNGFEGSSVKALVMAYVLNEGFLCIIYAS